MEPIERWQDLQRKIRKYNSKRSTKFTSSTRLAIQKLVFKYMYPRLDVNVSKHMNHLLKTPFSVHPKTGK